MIKIVESVSTIFKRALLFKLYLTNFLSLYATLDATVGVLNFEFTTMWDTCWLMLIT